VADAVAKLERLGLLKRSDAGLFAVPFDKAFANLHDVWQSFLPAPPKDDPEKWNPVFRKDHASPQS
jgi:hypothetical protein